FFITKKDNNIKLINLYIKLNKINIKNIFILLSINKILENFTNYKIISLLDLFFFRYN
ncbi:hypothetical protein GQ607_015120, partial [Colletotrichum asianum]